MPTSHPSTFPSPIKSDSHPPGFDQDSLPSPNLYERCLGTVCGAGLRLLSATWRVEVEGLEKLDELVETRQRHILAFWHRHYITLFHLFRKRPTISITNQSHRGQIIAQICRSSGMRTLQVEGKGSKRMLESLCHAADGGVGLGIAVDGPLGPACEVKRVVIHLASKLECPIVPVSVAARWKHVFASRWDRLEIPYLSSRVSFVIGDPIHVSMQSRTQRHALARRLQQTIDQGSVRAQRRLDSG